MLYGQSGELFGSVRWQNNTNKNSNKSFMVGISKNKNADYPVKETCDNMSS